MTELERVIHAAVAKAFKDFLEMQARERVFSMAPDTVERQAKYQELWDKAILHALDSLSKKEEERA